MVVLTVENLKNIKSFRKIILGELSEVNYP